MEAPNSFYGLRVTPTPNVAGSLGGIANDTEPQIPHRLESVSG